jgi:hypothetical protein
MPSLFGAKSGKAKALKSKTHAKTEKNHMAKVYKAKESEAKSGKSKALVSIHECTFSIDFLHSINPNSSLPNPTPPSSLLVSSQKDAKAEKELPSSKSGKRSKTAYHMFSKGHKMSVPAVLSMSL